MVFSHVSYHNSKSLRVNNYVATTVVLAGHSFELHVILSSRTGLYSRLKLLHSPFIPKTSATSPADRGASRSRMTIYRRGWRNTTYKHRTGLVVVRATCYFERCASPYYQLQSANVIQAHLQRSAATVYRHEFAVYFSCDIQEQRTGHVARSVYERVATPSPRQISLSPTHFATTASSA